MCVICFIFRRENINCNLSTDVYGIELLYAFNTRSLWWYYTNKKINVLTLILMSSNSLINVAIYLYLFLRMKFFLSQLIRYSRVCATYKEYLKRGKLLTNKKKNHNNKIRSSTVSVDVIIRISMIERTTLSANKILLYVECLTGF